MPGILILGDAPGPNTDPTRPLYIHTSTGSAARLADLMGMSHDDYLAGTMRLNVNHDGVAALTGEDARERLKALLEQWQYEPNHLVIVLGRNAAQRSPVTRGLEVGQPVDHGLGRIVLIPHTSGRNRYWNDPQNSKMIQRVLAQEIARTQI